MYQLTSFSKPQHMTTPAQSSLPLPTPDTSMHTHFGLLCKKMGRDLNADSLAPESMHVTIKIYYLLINTSLHSPNVKKPFLARCVQTVFMVIVATALDEQAVNSTSPMGYLMPHPISHLVEEQEPYPRDNQGEICVPWLLIKTLYLGYLGHDVGRT